MYVAVFSFGVAFYITRAPSQPFGILFFLDDSNVAS